jgi:EAL domain-containing protein (putative c-di-GMP-specific phosphodiesterase class I)
MFDIAMRDRAVSRYASRRTCARPSSGAFEVHYQPICYPRSTLAGSRRRDGVIPGAVDPAEFIPIAEDTETIVLIGRQVSRNAGRQQVAAAVRTAPVLRQRLQQFADDDLISQNVLQESAPPVSLKLEITESAFLRFPPRANDRQPARIAGFSTISGQAIRR